MAPGLDVAALTNPPCPQIYNKTEKTRGLFLNINDEENKTDNFGTS
jgi:hypothetical protein